MSWVRLGPRAELPRGAGVRVDVDGRELAVFDAGDRLVATDYRCPHLGGPLAEGCVADGVLVCPWHGWSYDVATGERVDRPGSAIGVHRVRERDGWVELEV